MLLVICTTQVKKRVKKEKEKNKITKKFTSRGFESGRSEYVRTKNGRLYPLDHLDDRRNSIVKRGIYSSSMVIDSFQGCFFSVSE